MSMDDNDGQMIFGDLGDLKLPDICLTGEEKPRKNLTQETSPERGSNPGPLHDRHVCYHLGHSGGHLSVLEYTDLDHCGLMCLKDLHKTVNVFLNMECH